MTAHVGYRAHVMDCIETRRLFAFAQGEMGTDAALLVEQHLDSCAACRALVAEAARSQDKQAPSSGLTHPPTEPLPSWLERGTLLGRYVVLERIGAGGMGVVHAAYDPELDRRVALKLIRIDSRNPARQEQARARLLREAQATARVIHPNVITIHDVGRFGEHVFLAMELVNGATLRSHIRSRKGHHDWRQTLGLFLQAGRGLAAAHAQGLVHRDFKPDNALVGGDGRVRITDFGLARIVQGIEETPVPPEAQSPGALRSEWLTRSDMVLGTPAYMSPEQKRGEPSDARSDQFSFCVALHEALYGRRPVETSAVGMRLPRESDVPAWIRQVILQGLSVCPDARHESMDVLLRRLTHAPGEKWRRAALAVSAGLVLVVGGAALHRSTSGDPCAGSEQGLVGVWDTPRREAVRTAFAASTLPYAATTWNEAARTLDAYARDWVAASHQACVATRVKGQQTERLLERRVICLDQRLKDLGAVADTLATGDTQVIQNAVRATHGLESLSLCTHLSALAAPEPPPTDEASQQRMEALRTRRAQVRAKLNAGQVKPALELATEAARQAHEVGYGPLEAEVLDLLAEAQGKNLHYHDAIKTLHHAIQVAEASRHDRQAAESWASIVRLLSFLGPEMDPDEQTARHAAAALKRMGGDARIEAMLSRNLSSLLRARKRPMEALSESLRALELARKVYTPDEPELGTALLSVSQALTELGRHEESIAYLLDAEAIYRKTYGPEHPYLGVVLDNLGVSYVQLGNPETAVRYGREGLSIYRRVHGELSVATASSLHNLGGFLMELGHGEESLQHMASAVRIREKLLGPQDAKVASSVSRMGTVLQSLGRFEEALVQHQRALDIREKALGPEHPLVAMDLLGLGLDHLGLKAPKKARHVLERAMALLERQPSGMNEMDLSDTRFALARALVNEPGGFERARKLASDAQLYNQRFPRPRARQLREVSDWMSARAASASR